MLIFIEDLLVDEICDKIDFDSFISQIMLAYKEGKHYIAIEPLAVKKMLLSSKLSLENKKVLNHYNIHNKDSKSIANKFSVIFKIISDTENETIYSDITTKIEYRCVKYIEFLDSACIQKSIILGENGNDAILYALFAEYFKNKVDLKHLIISYKGQTGGGDTTGIEFEKLIHQREETCLCIVDSDKKYPNKGLGGTAKKVKKKFETCFIAKPNYKCDYRIIDVHELENLLPKIFYKEHYERTDINKNGAFNRIEYLQSVQSNLRKYIDFKEGVKELSKYTDEGLGSFLGSLIICSGMKQTSVCESVCYIPGYGTSIISDFLSYKKDDLFKFVDCDFDIAPEWMEIGKVVASYVVGSSPIRIL